MQNTIRLHALDSLRGIFALIVMLGHCYYYSEEIQYNFINASAYIGSPWNIPILVIKKMIVSGRAGVILFFVLSGFVLTLSLINKKQSYKKFIMSRFFRMYPVLFISIIISYLLHAFIECNLIDSFFDWYKACTEAKPVPLTIYNLIGHLTLTGITPYHMYLDDPMWSLVHEFRISVILPILVLICARKKTLTSLPVIFILSIIGAYFVFGTTNIFPKGYTEKTLITSIAATIYFILFFSMGVLLALKREQISILINKFPYKAKFALLLTGMLCFIFNNRNISDFNSIVIDYLFGIGSAILIILSINWRGLSRLLTIKPLLWLGHISYSLYLVHKVILYAADKLFANILTPWQIIYIVIIISLICADLMARFIEYPCINLGKKLLSKTQ